jgi:hypothetical protein
MMDANKIRVFADVESALSADDVFNNVVIAVEQALTTMGATVSEGSEGELQLLFHGYNMAIEFENPVRVEDNLTDNERRISNCSETN